MYRLFGPEGARNQSLEALPDGLALKVIDLAILNSPSRKSYEIVLIQPFVQSNEVCPVRGVEPFKVFNRINNAIDSSLKRSSAPHLVPDVFAVLKVSHENAQTQESKDNDATHDPPVASRRNGEHGTYDYDCRGSIAQEASEQKHQNRVDQEGSEPDHNSFEIGALARRSQT